MKKGVSCIIVVVFLLFSSFTFAQEIEINNYNDYASLKMLVNINNSFSVSGDTSSIEFISANLSYFPRNEGIQRVDSLQFDANPAVLTSNYDENAVPFYWNKPNNNKFSLNVDSAVNVVNAMQTVDSKIKFPIDPIDTQYTRFTDLIDMDDDIRRKAQELAAGEDDLYVVAFKVAEWVETNIKYDLTTSTANAVQKSSWVLDNKIGVCDELTNLYISMMRSLGVPVRFVSGLAYTNLDKKWGPHAWAEVYFPNKGWVAFDVTYRQFGWIDPSHIVFRTGMDSGNSSIQYIWQGNDVRLSASKLNVGASLIQAGNKLLIGPVSLSVRPLVNKVGPGSYVPLEVTLENNQKFYVPEIITVVKAQELEGSNAKAILLKPGEKKVIYFIMKIPNDLDPVYSYTSLIEIQDMFNFKANNNVSYSFNGDVYSKEAAMVVAESKDERVYSKDLSLECKHKEYVYAYEELFFDCVLRNKGNTPLNGIRVCLEDNCKVSNLGIAEESYPNFTLRNLQVGRKEFQILAKSPDANAAYRVSLNVLNSPDLQIQEITYPEEVDFRSEALINALFIVQAPVSNVMIYIDEGFIAKVDELQSSKKVKIHMKGSGFLHKDYFSIKVTFKDVNGKDYLFEKRYDIKVKNIPWYIRFFRWIAGQN